MDTEQGKVFIGGISWETNEETLKDYFKGYGEVAETVIMRDRMTGRARGFGFIGFADPNVVDRVLQDKHTIDGRQVELKRAVPREEQQRNAQLKNSGSNMGVGPRTKKIFVGGLAPTVTEDDFRKYFEQFGSITDVVVMYDHVSQRPRGFGFITFDSEEAVDKVVMKTFHQLHDKMVEVKRALPKEMSPGSARARSSPAGGFGAPPNSRYGAPPPPQAGRGGYPPYGGAVQGYFAGGYAAPGVNGGGYGAPAAAAAPPPPAYGGAPVGYAGGAYGAGYGNPAYGAGAAAPYASAPMAGGYAAAAPGGASGPWASAMPTGQTAGGNAGYGYGGGGDATYSGGYGGATGTGAYVAPAAAAGGVNAGYQGGAGDVYGGPGYGDSYNAPPSGGGIVGAPNSAYAMGGPVQPDAGVNGSPGYGATGRQTQRVVDARFRPYPASGDRAS
uniref:TSA: Wollemia nobilis Ref_Wollemi_Transcript_1826_2202 transcribed RNA sequence n=1 Tax=Wollemia nobilis TaxID=56998 RepID=A0A0C9QX65_9CONI